MLCTPTVLAWHSMSLAPFEFVAALCSVRVSVRLSAAPQKTPFTQASATVFSNVTVWSA